MAGLTQSQQLLKAADVGPSTTPSRLVDTVTAALAQRAGTPGLFDILLLATPPKRGDAPERGTYLASRVQRPRRAAHRGAVRAETSPGPTTRSTTWTGVSCPGSWWASRLSVPGVGQYELYYLFPLTGEQETLDLVRRTVLGVGALLVLLVGLIAWRRHASGRDARPAGGAHRRAAVGRAPDRAHAGQGRGRPGPAGRLLQRDGGQPAGADPPAGGPVAGAAAVRLRRLATSCAPR